MYNHIYRILKRVQVEQPDAVLDQRHLAAKICHQMAEHASAQNNYNAAINHYKVGALLIYFEYLSLPFCLDKSDCQSTSDICDFQEALQFDPDDDVAMCALARLYLINDDLDQCQYTCMTLLR